jgi:hypothetical protein
MYPLTFLPCTYIYTHVHCEYEDCATSKILCSVFGHCPGQFLKLCPCGGVNTTAQKLAYSVQLFIRWNAREGLKRDYKPQGHRRPCVNGACALGTLSAGTQRWTTCTYVGTISNVPTAVECCDGFAVNSLFYNSDDVAVRSALECTLCAHHNSCMFAVQNASDETAQSQGHVTLFMACI